MQNFNDYFIKQNISIEIPALQRDYVQGGKEEVIEPFLNVLFDALKCKDKKIELNYIYGYSNDNLDFIPVDGQQRLITLWLVYLYLYATEKIKTENFPKLKFQSREFANDFANELLNQAKEKDGASSIIDKYYNLDDSPWFISLWKDDITVCNMIKTYSLIKSNMPKVDNIYPENIQFFFKDLHEKGSAIKDDIYLKMNGRGRPLSYYDNLKSYIDEKLEYEDFTVTEKDAWRIFIDNEWVNLIWNNRNRTQEVPDDIDDEEIHCFYNLIALYWLRYHEEKKELVKKLEKLTDDEKQYIYKTFVKSDNKNGTSNEEKVINAVIEKLHDKDSLIPLYWIEKLQLINKKVIEFIYKALNKLFIFHPFINKIEDENIGIDLYLKKEDKEESVVDKEKEPKTLYYLALTKTSYKSLAYLYSFSTIPFKYEDNEEAFKLFRRYVRVLRNLIENTELNYNRIVNVLSCIDNFAKVFEANSQLEPKKFYDKVANLPIEKLNKGFNETQVKEEIYKGKILRDHIDYEADLFTHEQYAFNRGAIRFLLPEILPEKIQDVPNSNANDNNIIETKFNKFKSIFTSTGFNENKLEEFMVSFMRNWAIAYDEVVFYVDQKIRSVLLEPKYFDIINKILYNQEESERDKQHIKKLEIEDTFNSIKGEYSEDLKKHYTYNYVKKNRLPNLLREDEGYFIKTLIKNKNLFANSRLKNNGGESFHPIYSRVGVYLNKPLRDAVIMLLFKDGVIEFPNLDNNQEAKANTDILTHYKELSEQSSSELLPFLMDWDLHFKLKGGKNIFSWNSNDLIYMFNKKWVRVSSINEIMDTPDYWQEITLPKFDINLFTLDFYSKLQDIDK